MNRMLGRASSQVVAEVTIGWKPGLVYMSGLLHGTATWTPEQAVQLAGHLLSAAEKATLAKEAT